MGLLIDDLTFYPSLYMFVISERRMINLLMEPSGSVVVLCGVVMEQVERHLIRIADGFELAAQCAIKNLADTFHMDPKNTFNLVRIQDHQ